MNSSAFILLRLTRRRSRTGVDLTAAPAAIVASVFCIILMQQQHSKGDDVVSRRASVMSLSWIKSRRTMIKTHNRGSEG